MRALIWLIILFATAIGLAMAARINPGNIVLFYPPYRIDMSLNFFLLLTVLTFVLLYMVFKAVRVTLGMPQKVAAYRQRKRESESNRALRDAVKSLFEGRFGQSEKAAVKAAAQHENAGVAALIAARAAHQMRQPERRDEWLAKVKGDEFLRTARLMTTIEILNDERQSEQALKAFNELNESGARHIHALRLALKANQGVNNWGEVLRLVRQLDKNKALNPALSLRLRELAHEQLLGDPGQDADALRAIWADIPAAEKTSPFVAKRAAEAFHVHGMDKEGRAAIEAALEKEWDDRLIGAYRICAAEAGSPALLAQIERCEEWAQQRPSDIELMLTLGVLCLKQKLWGKAQRHLEQVLDEASDNAVLQMAHLKLAQLHEALDHPQQAAEHYKQSALLTTI
jgi:HemY protein